MRRFKVDTRYSMVGGYIDAEGSMDAAKKVLADLRRRGNSSMQKPERCRKEFADCAITDDNNRTVYYILT